MRFISKTSAPVILAVLWLGRLCCGTVDGADTEFFESRIRPLLVQRCYQCHSPSESIKGGLELHTREGLLKGGESGPAIVPGKPEASLLIRAVKQLDKEFKMPPKGGKLTDTEIADLEAWIRMGAPDPRTGKEPVLTSMDLIREEGKGHWAYQPVVSPPLPKVNNRDWIKSPIDAFILARLEAAGLSPAPSASKATLLRRLTIDLTGLQPTREALQRLEADSSPDALSEEVDRLLESPRYGERWGRHWLDVARYADTKGYLPGGVERRYGYSYTYRDYVIRAFNEDLPYDRFIVEQLAADMLDLGEDKRPLAALGFLTLGRRFLNNKHDIIDDRIDLVTRGLMGLTVACARCHDHKYDPVPTADYYSLYGVFDSTTEPSEKPLLGVTPPKDLYQAFLAERAKREKKLQDFREAELAKELQGIRSRTADYLLAVHDVEQIDDRGKQMKEVQRRKLHVSAVLQWKQVMDALKSTHHPVLSHWLELTQLPTKAFAEKAEELSRQLLGPKDDDKPVNRILAERFSKKPPRTLKEAAERYGELFAEAGLRWEALRSENKEAKALPDPDWEAIRQVVYGPASPVNIPERFQGQLLAGVSPRLRSLQAEIDRLDATHAGAPPRAMVLVDNPRPSSPYIFVRGSSGNRGPQVPRQFLELLEGPERKPFQKGSGRLELARAIASRDNPLTARVLVNRVWMYHFGEPLVDTPSDFGLRSEAPSHPELLDYLAAWFMDNGWSVKKLHRLILNSATWQQASKVSEEHQRQGARVDPDNSLYWKMNRGRMDLEAMRDSMLQVTGTLDLAMGGLSVDISRKPFPGRRTVYAFINRQNLDGVFRTFDFANPETSNARRFDTIVPQQALFLMNSPFAISRARHLAALTDWQNNGDENVIRELCERVYLRSPTEWELESMKKFLVAEASGLPTSEENPWLYGVGSLDLQARRVGSFRHYPHRAEGRWQGDEKFPDAEFGYSSLTADGGHPGTSLELAAIRRWIAPHDGTIKIMGTLKHDSDKGNGVRGYVVSSGARLEHEWEVKNGAQSMSFELKVTQGDQVDFVVDAMGDSGFDSFNWAPRIQYIGFENASLQPSKKEWFAKRDFALSIPESAPLAPVEKLAQVLLLSNEFIFID